MPDAHAAAQAPRTGVAGCAATGCEGRGTSEVALVKVVACLAVEGARLVINIGQAAREQARLARCGRLALHLDDEALGDHIRGLEHTLEHAAGGERDFRLHAAANDVLGGQVTIELGVILGGLGGENLRAAPCLPSPAFPNASRTTLTVPLLVRSRIPGLRHLRRHWESLTQA